MTISRTDVIEQHPEWTDAPTAVIDGALAHAKAALDDTVLGDLFDTAVVLKTCQLLAHHPHARDMRLVDKSGVTIYDIPLNDILRAAGTAYRMVPL